MSSAGRGMPQFTTALSHGMMGRFIGVTHAGRGWTVSISKQMLT